MTKLTKEFMQDIISGNGFGVAPSAVAEMARQLLSSMEQEPVLYAAEETLAYAKMGELHLKCLSQPMGDAVIPLYAAPQLPQPAVEITQHFDTIALDTAKTVMCDVNRRHEFLGGDVQLLSRIQCRIDDACRAAMLQGAEPVSQPCKLPFEQWLSQQTGTIDVECGCVMTEVFYHWLRVAYEAGNSQVIPDDVRRMDWLVSKTVDVREPMVYGSHSLFWSQTITDEEDDYHATKLREQIDAAMAAEQAASPQQEVMP